MAALVGAALRVRGDPDAVTRAAARATLVGAALLVPMHSVEPDFTFTGIAPLIWITAAFAIGGKPAPRPEWVPHPAPRPLAAAS